MPKLLNLAGERFGRLTVLFRQPNKNAKTRWFCACDCGNKCIVKTADLRSGNTKSCGCLVSDKSSERMKRRNFVHGGRNKPEYRLWGSMKARCYRKSHHSYKDYGGRGIKICDRWLESFQNFYDDMGKRPSKKHSIERIDNDKNYSPDNCKWATMPEQQNNRRSNRMITIENETKTMKQWCDHFNVPYARVSKRISSYGWDAHKALTTPSLRKK